VSDDMKKKTLLTSALAVASVSSLLAFYPIANAQDAADSKLNLRTNSLLRMPSNIPQEHIYDSGSLIPDRSQPTGHPSCSG